MSDVNVISINPALQTKASLNPDIFDKINIEPRHIDMRVRTASEKFSRLKSRLNFFFGLRGHMPRPMSAKLFALRLLMGGLLIALGLAGGFTAPAFNVATCELILGVALILGFFTRMVSFAAFAVFATFATVAAIGGYIDLADIVPGVVALMFCVIGPGKYCIDSLMRRGMVLSARRRMRRRAEDRLSYRAFALSQS